MLSNASALLQTKLRQGASPLLWTAYGLILANAFAYVLYASNPLIISDGWFFLDSFVREALNHTLDIGDFLLKRTGDDHAIPLRKLFLLIELKYFHLDSEFEAVVGLVAGVGLSLFLRAVLVEKEAKFARHIYWLAISAVIFSLNSRAIWTWPLVTTAYINILLVFIFFCSVWKFLQGPALPGLLVATSILSIAADDTAVITVVAGMLALLLVASKSDEIRPRAKRCALFILLAFAAIRLLYYLFSPPILSATQGRVEISDLLSKMIHGGWLSWPTIILSGSVMYRTPVNQLFQSWAHVAQIMLTVLMIGLHAWFWICAFKRSPSRLLFMAVALMLTFYGLCAGIIYSRVSTFGSEYLSQPRYVLFYGLNIISLLMMAADKRGEAKIYSISLGFAVALIALQVPLSRVSWGEVQYISAYNQVLASQIGELAENPENASPKCLPELAVCQLPKAKRNELIRMLAERKLNIFSPDFQRFHRLYPYKLKK